MMSRLSFAASTFCTLACCVLLQSSVHLAQTPIVPVTTTEASVSPTTTAVVSGQETQALTAAAQQRAETILQQAGQALGGEATRNALQSLSVNGEYQAVVGQRPVKGDIKLELVLPNQFLKTTGFSPSPALHVKLLECVNGGEAWTDRKMTTSPIAPGGGAEMSGGGGMGGRGGMSGGGGMTGGGMGGRSGGMGGMNSGSDRDGMSGGGMAGGGMSGRGGSGGAGNSGRGRLPENPQAQALAQARIRAEHARLLAAWLFAAPANLPLTYHFEKEIEFAEGKADALRITSESHFVGYLLISQQTHQPVMLSYRDLRPTRPSNDVEEAERQNNAIDVQLYLRDYRQVDGCWFPHQISKVSNGQLLEEWKLKYKPNASIKPKVFEQPAPKN